MKDLKHRDDANAREWPVPLPHGVDLPNQPLDLEAEFVWLDTLCSRQKAITQIMKRLYENLKRDWLSTFHNTTVDVTTMLG